MNGVDSYHPKNLENRVDNNSFRPRDFFWDSVTTYVVTAIAGLAALDAVTEFLRTGLGGNRVVCTPRSDIDLTDGQAQYIDDICSKDLPRTEFFLVFIVVHGILLLIPHYLWLNHYGGAFDFFFSQASELQRLRSEDMGSYCDKNRFILQQLTVAFKTYNQILKLVFQWVLSIAGLIVTFFIFYEFQDTFICSANSTETSWPQPLAAEQMLCLFTPLRLYAVIRIVYLILVSLLIICFMWSLLWSFIAHPKELGSQDVADFSFQTGMLPEHYISNVWNRFCWPCQHRYCGSQYGGCQKHCCGPCRCLLHRFLILFPISGPRICTNLDFLVMKLFRTDSGLGHVFREMQILQSIENLNSDERSIVNLHRMEQKSPKLNNGDLIKDDRDLGWKIKKEQEEGKLDYKGIFDTYKPLEWHDEKTLMLHLPLPFRGALLGFSNMAPTNNLALYLTFGSPSIGIATALARVFHRVGIINFSPYFKASIEQAVVERTYFSTIFEYVTAVDILSQETSITNEFTTALKSLFEEKDEEEDEDEDDEDEDEDKTHNEDKDKKDDDKKGDEDDDEDEDDNSLATFIIIGPLDKAHYKFTVSHFLTDYSSNIKEGCILLTVHPLEVSGKKTGNEFHTYQPPPKTFTRLASQVKSIDEDSLMWPPKTTTEKIIKIDPQSVPLLCGDSLSWFQFETFYRPRHNSGTGANT